MKLDACETETRECGSRWRKMASRISVGKALNEGRVAIVVARVGSDLPRIELRCKGFAARTGQP